MARGLDHIVHAVRDLDAAAGLYRRLGFTVGARNRHPWGTHNQIVQLPGFFIELLTVAEPEKLGDDGISVMFGDFNRRFFEAHEGLSLLILESRDAVADARAFETAHIAASAPMRFSREGRRPDGSPVAHRKPGFWRPNGTPVEVAISRVFARDPRAPETGLAVCEQHHPENFWNAEFQQHANGVTDIGGAVIVAENPSDHHIVMSAFTGVRDLQSSSSGIVIATPRGDIRIMTPAAFEDHFGLAAPDVSTGARLVAVRFVASDLSRVQGSLLDGKVASRQHLGRVIVPPEAAHGAAIIFEPAGGQ
jgi:hypothetical protein